MFGLGRKLERIERENVKEEFDSTLRGINDGLLDIEIQRARLPFMVNELVEQVLQKNPNKKVSPEDVVEVKASIIKQYGQTLYESALELSYQKGRVDTCLEMYKLRGFLL
jgi:hypothetical protein